MLLTDQPVVEPDENEIYLSLYRDGVYRQRCGRHIEESIAPLMMVWRKSKASARHSCVMCAYERRKGGGGDVVEIDAVE